MIKLTKFTGEDIFVNPEMIKSVELAGDTVLALATGERLLVKESGEEIQARFVQYKQEIQRSSFSSPVSCEI